MRFHSSPQGHSGKSLFAFIAGATVALIVGGYFLFGPQGSRNRRGVDRWLKRAKFEILDRMEHLENITEQQYYAIVDEVMERYGKVKDFSQEKIDQGRASFKQRWEEMREAARQARDQAREEVDEEERRQGISSKAHMTDNVPPQPPQL